MKTKTNSGFTLIELLLSVSITGVLLLTITFFLGAVLQVRVKNQTIAEVNEQALAVMQLISQTVRNAESITSPAPGQSTESLSLDQYDAAKDPTVFDLSGGVVHVTEGGSAAVPLTNNRVTASGFTVQNLSRPKTPGLVRIEFTLSHINPSLRNEYEYSKTFSTSVTVRQP